MDEETLAAIRERAEKATPGPWSCFNGYVRARGTDEDAPSDEMCMVRIGPYSNEGGIRAQWGNDLQASRADAEFTACAREDIPALLAEVERLRALEEENAQLRALLSDAYDSWFYGDEASYSSPPWVDRAMALLGKAREGSMSAEARALLASES